MKSLTKSILEKTQLDTMTKHAFNQLIVEYRELNNGFFNMSYLVLLEDGREMVLKVAPPLGVDILTYEIDIMKAEVEFYQLTERHTDVMVPSVLFSDFTLEILPVPYYFMSKLEGQPLNLFKEINTDKRKKIYIKIAESIAKIHSIEGESFGYISMSDSCKGLSYYDSFMVSVGALLDDAERKTTGFPIPKDKILEGFLKTQEAFNNWTTPVLCHYDLWDGNIFVDEAFNVTGLIDFERGFYGDPAADFAQAAGYISLEKDRYFIDTYNEFANTPIEMDRYFMTRVHAYRLYVFIIMHVECFYRDVDGSFDGQKQWVSKEIMTVFNKLMECV